MRLTLRCTPGLTVEVEHDGVFTHKVDVPPVGLDLTVGGEVVRVSYERGQILSWTVRGPVAWDVTTGIGSLTLSATVPEGTTLA